MFEWKNVHVFVKSLTYYVFTWACMFVMGRDCNSACSDDKLEGGHIVRMHLFFFFYSSRWMIVISTFNHPIIKIQLANPNCNLINENRENEDDDGDGWRQRNHVVCYAFMMQFNFSVAFTVQRQIQSNLNVVGCIYVSLAGAHFFQLCPCERKLCTRCPLTLRLYVWSLSRRE